jgi:hypothetical protein
MLRSASLGVATAGIAVACCVGVPLVAGALGGLALVPVIGIAGALIAALSVFAAFVRVRQRKGNVQ